MISCSAQIIGLHPMRAQTPASTLCSGWMGSSWMGSNSTGAGYHVVALGSFQGVQRGMGLQQAMEATRAQGGMLILAHPHWMGNTFEDALRWQFDGVEVYNHVCRWLNGKGDGGPYWSAMLTHYPNTLAFSVG